jgi:hypothetical protein
MALHVDVIENLWLMKPPHMRLLDRIYGTVEELEEWTFANRARFDGQILWVNKYHANFRCLFQHCPIGGIVRMKRLVEKTGRPKDDAPYWPQQNNPGKGQIVELHHDKGSQPLDEGLV